MSAPIHRVIVGTAGHIDHGKSTLVHTLTGIDPDRLKEEKERGMTIDLGFARYRTGSGRTVGIIDVPGHERFVKNMVAGASSVDIFLLVVAADDGVMPQTREHVEILDLLGARRGLVAVTKIDLVDPDLRELAIAEIQDYLQGTPFEGAPLVPISSLTGEGIDRLRGELDRLIDETEARASSGLFRMPIQRVFSAHGHGTVVTGVPVSGETSIGAMLEVLPLGRKGKVRAIQAYLEDRADASAGHSTALNLSDLDYREVVRGMVVATPGYYRPTVLLEARLRYLGADERPLKHGADVRVHIGTCEALARVILLESAELAPGEESLVQLRMREPIVATRGDRFLIRQPSPMVTLGGGVVISESERRITRTREQVVATVRDKAEVIDQVDAFLERALFERAQRPTPRRDIARLIKRPDDEAAGITEALIQDGRIRDLGHDKVMHASAFAAALDQLRGAMATFHRQNPLRAFATTLEVRKVLRLDDALLDAVVDALVTADEVVAEKGGRLRLKDAGPRLSEAQVRLRDDVLARVRGAGLSPPRADEIATATRVAAKEIESLLALLVEQGELVRAGDLCFDAQEMTRAVGVVREIAGRHAGEVIVPEVRDALNTTRKFLIPIMEYLDSRGVTTRRGDKRYLVEIRA